jgi:hypothetical protein
MKKQPQSNKYRQLAESCAEWLARGCSIAGTAAKHGISRETLYSWQEILHFQELIEKYRENWRMKLLKEIEENAQWTAKAWLLERVFREYDPPSTSRQGSNGVIVQISISHPCMPDPEDTNPKLIEATGYDHETSPQKDNEDESQ